MLQQLYTLSGQTRDELALAAVKFLVGEGYAVEQPGQWETRGEFCTRIRISTGRFKRMMKRMYRPCVELQTGPCGRLIQLRSTPSFDRWMQGPGKGRETAR